MLNVYISWPGAPLKNSLVYRALEKTPVDFHFIAAEDRSSTTEPLLQWCTYDDMDHELAHTRRETVLSSSYTFRKALIRKHYLSRIIHSYLTKTPASILRTACPMTFEIELSFADELDEMWTDELWEVGERLDSGESWWILKPGMADRGMGIRLFNSKNALQSIFESFESDSGDEDGDGDDGTAVVTSQLRHFVIQEYIMNPMLIDPAQMQDEGLNKAKLVGRKFHLRVYCVSNGDIQLYVYDRILALFSSEAYVDPNSAEDKTSLDMDLRPHLTNTSLQTAAGEANVRLLSELEGCQILSGDKDGVLKKSDITAIISQVKDVLVDTFRAALQNPVHFQPLPNAFELFGVDFLVSHTPSSTHSPFEVKILEINSEPAIELTGPRLYWILEDLFLATAEVCIVPFTQEKGNKSAVEVWNIGEVRHNLIKCMDETVRAPGPSK